MIVKTETEILLYEQLVYYPFNKLHIEFMRMEDWLRNEGHELLERYRYESLSTMSTCIGIVSKL